MYINSVQELFKLYPEYCNWDDWFNVTYNPTIGKLTENNPIWESIQNDPYEYDWYELIKNPNVTWEIIKKYSNFPWDFTEIANNPNITWRNIQEFNRTIFNLRNLIYPNNDFFWSDLSRHSNITWKIIQQNSKKPWNLTKLSANSNISWQIMQQNPQLWCLDSVAENPNMPCEILSQIISKLSELDPDKYAEAIQIENVVFQYSPKRNNWCKISGNPALTLEIIQNNQKLPWDWLHISSNPKITWKTIQSNCKLPWCLTGFSQNLNITMEIVIQTTANWNWRRLSQNPSITIDEIELYSDKPWEYEFVSSNSNVYWENVVESLYKDWKFANICSCKNVFNELRELNLTITYYDYTILM